MCCFLVKLDVVVRFAADVCFRRLFLSSLNKRELVLLTLENGRVEKKKKKTPPSFLLSQGEGTCVFTWKSVVAIQPVKTFNNDLRFIISSFFRVSPAAFRSCGLFSILYCLATEIVVYCVPLFPLFRILSLHFMEEKGNTLFFCTLVPIDFFVVSPLFFLLLFLCLRFCFFFFSLLLFHL